MTLSLLRSNAGFTYIAALMLVIVLGISISGAANSWKMQMQRERETELMFRLQQYRTAMRRWYKLDTAQPGAVSAAVPLTDLKQLLKDPNNPSPVRYLRKLYKDPITGKDFEPNLDANKRIVGVKSTSEAEPLKKANFPDEFANFEDKKTYKEFEFSCFITPPSKASGGGAQHLETTGPEGAKSGTDKNDRFRGVPGWSN